MTDVQDFWPDEAVLPDYQGGGLLNLMASIGRACGAASAHPPLAGFDARPQEQAHTLALVVIDGLGADFLAGSLAGGFLQSSLLQTLTSVFPSTTAAAITTFMTGESPAEHGVTGWHMHFSELGCVAAVLPFRARHGGMPLQIPGLGVTELLAPRPLFDRIERPSVVLSPAHIAHSPFNRAFSGRAEIVAYDGPAAFFGRLQSLLDQRPGHYIHAYYPYFDLVAHEFGVASPQALAHARAIDAALAEMAANVRGCGATLLVTADHGFADVDEARRMRLADLPDLAAGLVLPLCGEQRAAYAYVRPEAAAGFIDRAAAALPDLAVCRSSAELAAAGLFGPGRPHPRFPARIGDYTLLMQPGAIIVDALAGERCDPLIGVHGGLSSGEMRVPLVQLDL